MITGEASDYLMKQRLNPSLKMINDNIELIYK